MIFNVMWSPMGSTVYVFCALQKLHIVWNKRNLEARFARILVKSLKNKVSLIVYLAVIFRYFVYVYQTANKSQHHIRDHFFVSIFYHVLFCKEYNCIWFYASVNCFCHHQLSPICYHKLSNSKTTIFTVLLHQQLNCNAFFWWFSRRGSTINQ